MGLFGMKRDQWEDLVLDYWSDQKLFIVGQYSGYIEDGLSERVALRQTRRDFYDLICDEILDDLAGRADDAVTWRRVKRVEIRKTLERLDGVVFRALLRGALSTATARLTGAGAGFAGLLAVADATIDAAQDALTDPEPEMEVEAPSEAPTVITGSPARPSHRVPVPDWFTQADEAEPAEEVTTTGSAAVVKERLETMLQEDRVILGDPRALEATDDDDDDDDDDDGGEVEPLRARLPRLPGGMFSGLVLPAFLRGGDK